MYHLFQKASPSPTLSIFFLRELATLRLEHTGLEGCANLVVLELFQALSVLLFAHNASFSRLHEGIFGQSARRLVLGTVPDLGIGADVRGVLFARLGHLASSARHTVAKRAPVGTFETFQVSPGESLSGESPSAALERRRRTTDDCVGHAAGCVASICLGYFPRDRS